MSLVVAKQQAGVVPKDFDQLIEFCKIVARSGIVPDSIQGKTLEETAARVLVVVQFGYELGLSAMTALQSICVINNMPSLYGDGMLAVVRQSGLFDESAFKEEIIERDGTLVARCTVRRLPNGQLITREYSLRQAQAAGLTSKQVWRQFPHRMLQMRARSWALRDAFADVLKGLRAAEELLDLLPAEQVQDKQQQCTISALQLLGDDKELEQPANGTEQKPKKAPAKTQELAGLIERAESIAELHEVGNQIAALRISEANKKRLRELWIKKLKELEKQEGAEQKERTLEEEYRSRISAATSKEEIDQLRAAISADDRLDSEQKDSLIRLCGERLEIVEGMAEGQLFKQRPKPATAAGL